MKKASKFARESRSYNPFEKEIALRMEELLKEKDDQIFWKEKKSMFYRMCG